MKRLIIALVLCQSAFSQNLPYKATVSVSKEIISLNEEFTVSYFLTDVEGSSYVGVVEDFFEVVGPNKWSGELKWGEVKKIEFRLRLKETVRRLTEDKALVTIIYNTKPFRGAILEGEPTYLPVKISQKFGESVNKPSEIPFSVSSTTSTVTVVTAGTIQGTEVNIQVDSSAPKLEAPAIPTPSVDRHVTRFSDDGNASNVIDLGPTAAGSPLAEIRFTASAISFRNHLGQKVPWQYYKVWIRGLTSTSDPNPVVLSEQSIGASATGGFSISTTQTANYYQLVLLAEGPVYWAFKPPSTWDGSSSFTASVYGASFNLIANPGVNTEYQATDPDFW